jgi:hypothetical protein
VLVLERVGLIQVLGRIPGIPVNLYSRINLLLASPNTSRELDAFVSDLRDSIASSSKQFIAYPTLIIAALVTYYVATRLGTSVTISGVSLTDTSLIRRAFLVVPASLITAYTTVGYLRKMQRVVYEYIVLPRYPVLHKAKFHELRLPSDYISGLFLLHEEGGKLGKYISVIVTLLVAYAFLLGPMLFIVSESITNVMYFGTKDVICFVASFVSVLLCACSLIIVSLAGQLKVEAPDDDEQSNAA